MKSALLVDREKREKSPSKWGAAMTHKPERGGPPWQGRPGWTQPLLLNPYRVNSRHFLTSSYKDPTVTRWALLYLLTSEEEKACGNKGQSSRDGIVFRLWGPLYPAKPVYRSQILSGNTLRRRGWRNQKCACFFLTTDSVHSSRHCTVSLLHPILEILPHTDHWIIH